MTSFLEFFFYIQSTLDSEFFRGDVRAPTFFSHTNFEVKIFSEFFHLESTLDYEFFTGGGLGTNIFWSC